MNRYEILLIEKSFLGKQKLQFMEWSHNLGEGIKELPRKLKRAWKNRARSMWDDLSRIAFITFLFQLIIFCLSHIYRGGRASNVPVIIWGLIFLLEVYMSKRCRQKKQEAQ